MSATAKHLWIALLLAGLVLAAAVWPSGLGTEAAAAPAARAVHTITIPAAAFIPSHPGIEYLSDTAYLSAQSGFAGFIAPVQFPYPSVTITRITLHAYDNGPAEVCLFAARTRPATGAQALIGNVCSSGQAATDPRSFATTAIITGTVNSTHHGVSLGLVFLPPGSSYKFYGVTIRYEA